MIEGNFIALEGIDGAGTTTHSRLLAKALRARDLPIHDTHEPSTGPVGVLLRQMLSGRVVVPGIQGARPPSWSTMALLFAADRLDHLEAEIVPNLMDGVTVITDRYDHSSIAYQSVTAGDDPGVIDWLKQLNRQARRPDLTIVLDVDPEVAEQRRASRSTQDIYEDGDLQRRLAAFYREIEVHFPGDRICHVDANGDIEDVAASVMALVRELRGEPPEGTS